MFGALSMPVLHDLYKKFADPSKNRTKELHKNTLVNIKTIFAKRAQNNCTTMKKWAKN